jgi:hypothetical protein
MGMSAQDWHPGEVNLAHYAARETAAAMSASVEAHLIRCADCRADLVPHTQPAMIQAGRDLLRVALVHRRHPFLVRVAERLGLPDSLATVLTESRAMSDAWLAALFVVLGFAAGANTFSGWLGDAVFLLVAPLVPVVGVAMVFTNTEPALEQIARGTPFSALRLLLLRTAAVLVTGLPLCFVAAAVQMDGPGVLAAWLLPALAGTVLVLALATWFSVELVASAVGLSWAFAVGTAALRQNPSAIVAAPEQLLYLVLAALAAVVVALQAGRGRVPGGIA